MNGEDDQYMFDAFQRATVVGKGDKRTGTEQGHMKSSQANARLITLIRSGTVQQADVLLLGGPDRGSEGRFHRSNSNPSGPHNLRQLEARKYGRPRPQNFASHFVKEKGDLEMAMTQKEQEQVKEAKKLAREQGLSMTTVRGAGMWLRYEVTMRGGDRERVCSGYIADVLRVLRARAGKVQQP
jgi:hypothetical protein